MLWLKLINDWKVTNAKVIAVRHTPMLIMTHDLLQAAPSQEIFSVFQG